MRNRIASLVMCLCMFVTILPTAAWAADTSTDTESLQNILDETGSEDEQESSPSNEGKLMVRVPVTPQLRIAENPGEDVKMRVTFEDGTTATYTDFATGWNYAATASDVNNPATVKLGGDWTATHDDGVVTSFGTGEGFGNGSSTATGYILVPSGKNITLDLNGYTINRGLTAAKDDGYVIKNAGTLTLQDSSAQKTGIITGGNNNGNGGGVFNESGIFTMEGGTIASNTADNGGGVYNIGPNGNFTMEGGSIASNTSTGAGGGVYKSGGTFTMTGGSIASNTASLAGGGVHNSGGGFNVSGAVQITGNTKGGAANNVYLALSSFITVAGALRENASIGVTTERTPPVSITAATNTDYASFFTSDVTDYACRNSGSGDQQVVQLVMLSNVMEVTIGGSTATYTVFLTGWNAAVEADKATVKLLADWTAHDTGSFGTSNGFIPVHSGSNITLDLNGHTINRGLTEAKDDGYVIKNGGTLTLQDSSAQKTGTITGGNNNNGNGGGVYNNGTFTMEGGTIKNNTAFKGGGVYNDGGFTMKGGTIASNTSTGGGVYNGGTFTMEGGSIASNTSSTSGGGVYNKGTFKVSGAVRITDNTKGGAANNVYLPSNKAITVAGALSETASIGVTTQFNPNVNSPVKLTAATNTDYASFFTSDVTDYACRNSGSGDQQVVQLAEIQSVSQRSIVGVTAPVGDAAPVMAITNEQYNGTVSWSPAPASSFAYATFYTATITLTEKPGYVFDASVTENFFTVAGAATVTNAAYTAGDSIEVIAQFPATGAAPVVSSGSSHSYNPYFIISGVGQNYTGKVLAFRSNADYSDFRSVDVDGKTLTRGTQYGVRSGSTIVTLYNDFLKTLTPGVHTLNINSAGGSASTTFTVGLNSAQTGDAGILLYAGMALLSLTGMGYVGKKKELF